MEAPPGFEPGMEVLQTSALPLGDGAVRKGPETQGRRMWSGKRDSNPRLRPWQGRTLPLSYSRSSNFGNYRNTRFRSSSRRLAAPALARRRPMSGGCEGTAPIITSSREAPGTRPHQRGRRTAPRSSSASTSTIHSSASGRTRSLRRSPRAIRSHEGVGDDFHLRPPGPHRDRHDIKSTDDSRGVRAGEIVQRHQRQLSLLRRCHGGKKSSEPTRRTRLNLDEHEDRTMRGNDADLAMARAVAARKDCVPATSQLTAREIFSQFTEVGLMRCRHAQQACKVRAYFRFQRVPAAPSSSWMPRASRSSRM